MMCQVWDVDCLVDDKVVATMSFVTVELFTELMAEADCQVPAVQSAFCYAVVKVHH